MVLVTGATGNVGRSVVEQLLAAGQPVRAMTRDPGRARFPSGVAVVRGDMAQPATLPAALEGVDRAFLFPAGVTALLEAARGGPLRRVVLMSSAAVAMGGDNAIARGHAPQEEAVRRSGLEWILLRPGAFMVNDLAWAAQIRDGVVRAPFGDASSAPIDERDIAAVAVRALLADDLVGQAPILTGPESLTVAERVRILGEVLGRAIRFVEMTPAEARRAMGHMPPALVETLLGFAAASVGRPAPVADTVAAVTGRPATPYRAWADRHRGAFGGEGLAP